jgi:hypothetical protein
MEVVGVLPGVSIIENEIVLWSRSASKTPIVAILLDPNIGKAHVKSDFEQSATSVHIFILKL